MIIILLKVGRAVGRTGKDIESMAKSTEKNTDAVEELTKTVSELDKNLSNNNKDTKQALELGKTANEKADRNKEEIIKLGGFGGTKS